MQEVCERNVVDNEEHSPIGYHGPGEDCIDNTVAIRLSYITCTLFHGGLVCYIGKSRLKKQDRWRWPPASSLLWWEEWWVTILPRCSPCPWLFFAVQGKHVYFSHYTPRDGTTNSQEKSAAAKTTTLSTIHKSDWLQPRRPSVYSRNTLYTNLYSTKPIVLIITVFLLICIVWYRIHECRSAARHNALGLILLMTASTRSSLGSKPQQRQAESNCNWSRVSYCSISNRRK